MRYYFPSALTSLQFPAGKLPATFFEVNSGENAVRLLLRSFGLKPGAKVALPLFVCDSLKRAVLKEGLEPLYLDLKADGTFWADHDPEILKKEKPAVIILAHLYGFLHPDTDAVMRFCEANNIYLVHDAAQSFGIDESLLKYSSGLVYSFGPGKSTTAAGGALVNGIEDKFYIANCQKVPLLSAQNINAKLFLRSRIFGYQFTVKDKLLYKIFNPFRGKNKVRRMTDFQRKAAVAALISVKENVVKRKERYGIIEKSINANPHIQRAYESNRGVFFKIILKVKGDVEKVKNYLLENNIPFFALRPGLIIGNSEFDKYPQFMKHSAQLIELSTEASLPIKELERVGDLLKKYKE